MAAKTREYAMRDTGMLDDQIRKAAFWSAITVILMGVLSLYPPA